MATANCDLHDDATYRALWYILPWMLSYISEIFTKYYPHFICYMRMLFGPDIQHYGRVWPGANSTGSSSAAALTISDINWCFSWRIYCNSDKLLVGSTQKPLFPRPVVWGAVVYMPGATVYVSLTCQPHKANSPRLLPQLDGLLRPNWLQSCYCKI